MILQPTVISTEHLVSRFDGYEQATVMSAEASSLGWQPSRVYDDACDIGYTLISHKTGAMVVFAESHRETHEGDLLYTDYEPVGTPMSGIRYNGIPCLLRIYND